MGGGVAVGRGVEPSLLLKEEGEEEGEGCMDA